MTGHGVDTIIDDNNIIFGAFIVGTKIFIGGLNFSVDENILRTEFSKFGVVKNVKLCKDSTTGKSRGFAFITYTSSAEAELAITEMDGKEFYGRKIGVADAIEKK